MPENSTRKLTIGILFLLTFAISVAAVYIGIKLSQDPSLAPDSTFAAEGDNPVCISEDFGIGSEPSESTWIIDTSQGGIATLADGTLVLSVPSATSSASRYSRAITFASFAADFLVKVDLTSISEATTGSSESHIAKLAFPYFQDTEDADESYKVEAYLTTDESTSETVIELQGYIGPSNGTVQLPLSALGGTSSTLTLKIERESQLTGNDLVTISYNTGTGDQVITSGIVQSNITDAGSFYLEALSEDQGESSASFDNFEVQCGGPAITIGPSNTPAVSSTPVSQVTSTPGAGITVTPTVIVTTANLPTPTITLAPFISPIPTATPVALPQTAIINESADRLLFAFGFILAGFAIYSYSRTQYKKQ